MVSLNRKRKLFKKYNIGLVTFDHYNSFENNFTTALRFATNYHGMANPALYDYYGLQKNLY